MTIEPQLIILAFTGLFVAGVIKGGTGLGYTTCALPFVVPAVGLQAGMVVVLAPAIATNLGVALTAGHVLDTCRRFKTFYLASLPGIACGVLALSLCDAVIATRLLGVSLLLYAVMALWRPNLVLPQRVATWLQGPAGFANGVVTGLTGSQVMPLFPYMMSLKLEPDRFVQAVNLSVLLSSLVLGAALTLSGSVDANWFAVSLAAVLPALLGVRIGNALRGLLSPERFRIMVLAVLLVMAVALLAK